MSGKGRERIFIGLSAVALLGALAAGIFMLMRARAIWDGEEEAALRVQLLERRDELRGAVAEVTSLRSLRQLDATHDRLEDFRSDLRDTARAFQDDPLDGNDDPGVFACVALEIGGGDDGLSVWTSGPIDEDDRTWSLSMIASSDTGQGTRKIDGQTRILGIAWSTYRVAGEPHVGALAWITPRSR